MISPTNLDSLTKSTIVDPFSNSIQKNEWFLCPPALFLFYSKYCKDHLISTLLHKSPASYDNVDSLAFHGRLDLLKILFNSTSVFKSKCTLFLSAVSGNHLNVLIWLNENMENAFQIYSSDLLLEDAATKSPDLFYYLYNSMNNVFKTKCTQLCIDNASSSGNLEIIEFLHDRKEHGFTKWAMINAAANGHLKILQFLHDNRKEGCSNLALNLAAKHNHLSIVEFLVNNRINDCNIKEAMCEAVENNCEECVEYLKKKLGNEKVIKKKKVFKDRIPFMHRLGK